MTTKNEISILEVKAAELGYNRTVNVDKSGTVVVTLKNRDGNSFAGASKSYSVALAMAVGRMNDYELRFN